MRNKVFFVFLFLLFAAAACNVPSAKQTDLSYKIEPTSAWVWDLNAPIWNLPDPIVNYKNEHLHTPTPQLFSSIDFDQAFVQSVPAALSSKPRSSTSKSESAEWLFFEPAEYSTAPIDTLYAYFKNTGDSEWNEQYYLEFFAGSNPSPSDRISLAGITKPGDRGVFQIPIASNAGSWKSCWNFNDPDGKPFYEFCYNHGTGSNAETNPGNKSTGSPSNSNINPAFVKISGNAPAKYSSDEQSAVFLSTSPAGGHTFKAYDHNENLTVSFRNSGTETWDQSYSLVFYSGYNWMHATSFNLQGTVSSGETASFTLPMEIFEDNDKWVTCWYLSTPDGKNLADFCFNYFTRS